MSERKILEQSIKDHKKAIDKAEGQLKKLEVTYSIGDRFTHSGEKFIIAGWYDGVRMVLLSSGETWSGDRTTKVSKKERITPSELRELTSSTDFTRYWNSQKGCEE